MVFFASASIQARSIVVVLADGTEIYYLVDNSPVMKWNDGVITVSTDNYELEGISRFYVSETDDPTAIETLMDRQGIEYTANSIVVLAQDKPVSLFTVDGKAIELRQSTSGAYVSVDTSTLEKGVYIVRIGNQTIKFQKR